MSKILLVDHNRGTERECESIAEAEEKKEEMRGLGAQPDDLEIITGDKTASDGGGVVDPDIVSDAQETHNPQKLSKDPIGFLESINSDFVNAIKGTPAISKQGFRFIQREFTITTQSEVVQWIDEPLGCVVWARAELDNSYSAEAHGEGYQFESGVSDNEFVRYADSRAKNRAISDLTAAGALAVEELSRE